jgi:hypothetical protein
LLLFSSFLKKIKPTSILTGNVKIKIIHAVVIICSITRISLLGTLLEVNAQPQEVLKKYEIPELGASFQYPSSWGEPGLERDNCLTTNICGAVFTIFDGSAEDPNIYLIAVRGFKLDEPVLGNNPCNCNTLKDYVAWRYNTDHKGSTFINDNQTIIPSNRSAWQIETISPSVNIKKFQVLTIDGNIGYSFIYSGPADDRYGEYLDSFKKMVKSGSFTPPIPEKKPSFLNSSNIVNISSTGNSIPFLNKSDSVTILSHNSYTDSAGYFHVVGEVENNTPNTAQFVQVAGTFYDINNAVVGTQFTYTNPSDIISGGKAPFNLILISASVPTSLIDHYNLQASYQ